MSPGGRGDCDGRGSGAGSLAATGSAAATSPSLYKGSAKPLLPTGCRVRRHLGQASGAGYERRAATRTHLTLRHCQARLGELRVEQSTPGQATATVTVFKTEAAAKARYVVACPIVKGDRSGSRCQYANSLGYKRKVIHHEFPFVTTAYYFAYCRNLEVETVRTATTGIAYHAIESEDMLGMIFAKAVSHGMTPVSAGKYPCNVGVP